LNKPVRKPNVDDDLPSIDSHDEDEAAWSSGIDDDADTTSQSSVNDSDQDPSSEDDLDSDAEMSYERVPRKVPEPRETKTDRHIQRLPIKSADGQIHSTGVKIAAPPSSDEEGNYTDESAEEQEMPVEVNRIDDVATGARFGRPAVIDIVGNKSRTARIQGAKDQIASICQEIIAEPENSVRTSPPRQPVCLTHLTVRTTSSASHFLSGENYVSFPPRAGS
jgi:nucleolar complex protein 3